MPNIVEKSYIAEVLDKTMGSFITRNHRLSGAVRRIDADAGIIDAYHIILAVRNALFSLMPERGICLESLRDLSSSFGVPLREDATNAKFNTLFASKIDVFDQDVVKALYAVVREVLGQWMTECFCDVDEDEVYGSIVCDDVVDDTSDIPLDAEMEAGDVLGSRFSMDDSGCSVNDEEPVAYGLLDGMEPTVFDRV